jgi:hypothetical protein
MTRKAAENDLKVLAPATVTWEIGDLAFEQAPATLDRLADIMDVIVDEVLAGGKGDLLDKLMDTATAVGKDDSPEAAVEAAKSGITSDREMLMSFVRIIATLPRALPRIAAAILGAPEDYLRANLRPKEASGILRVFVQQNDVGSIIQDFFALFQELKASLATDESDSS